MSGRMPRSLGRRIHQPVELGVRAGLGRNEIAHHEMGDRRLMAEVPSDRARVVVCAPVQLFEAEISPEIVGVAECTVVLDEELAEPATGRR